MIGFCNIEFIRFCVLCRLDEAMFELINVSSIHFPFQFDEIFSCIVHWHLTEYGSSWSRQLLGTGFDGPQDGIGYPPESVNFPVFLVRFPNTVNRKKKRKIGNEGDFFCLCLFLVTIENAETIKCSWFPTILIPIAWMRARLPQCVEKFRCQNITLRFVLSSSDQIIRPLYQKTFSVFCFYSRAGYAMPKASSAALWEKEPE